MQNPLPPLYEIEENEEQFVSGQRILSESFGDVFEWYEHHLRLEQLRLEQQEQQDNRMADTPTPPDHVPPPPASQPFWEDEQIEELTWVFLFRILLSLLYFKI